MLILVRGIPGSGKSTTAHKLNMDVDNSIVLEADNYLYDNNGKYIFTPSRAKIAHIRCKKDTKKYLNMGKTVIVANTFAKMEWMHDYLDIAYTCKTICLIYTCKNSFGSVHDAPEDKMQWYTTNFEEVD